MPATVTDVELTEAQRSMLWRYEDARKYGLTRLEARLYAESDIDCSELRKLVRLKVPPLWGARILL